MAYKNDKPHYEHLKDKWGKLHQKLQKNLWKKHGKSIQSFRDHLSQHAVAAGSLASVMLFASPVVTSPLAHFTQAFEKPIKIDERTQLSSELKTVLPAEVRLLSDQEEASVSALLSRKFGFRVVPDLGGKRLNRTYGYIGAEQHLARFPADTIFSHFDTQEDAKLYAGSGMASGLGAWGYFAPSREALTEKDNLRERYYVAVQTFLAPGFNENLRKYIDFFKYRKMLIVNPDNGRSMVTVIGDAGPATWTGKHLGGSPEVMSFLERVDGASKGPVLYFFIDDPEDAIPLGPITVQ